MSLLNDDNNCSVLCIVFLLLSLFVSMIVFVPFQIFSLLCSLANYSWVNIIDVRFKMVMLQSISVENNVSHRNQVA